METLFDSRNFVKTLRRFVSFDRRMSATFSMIRSTFPAFSPFFSARSSTSSGLLNPDMSSSVLRTSCRVSGRPFSHRTHDKHIALARTREHLHRNLYFPLMHEDAAVLPLPHHVATHVPGDHVEIVGVSLYP